VIMKVEDTTPLTPHEKAILAAGEELMISSVATSRDFCKTMIGIAISAIPVEVTLLKLFIPKDLTILEVFGALWVVPVVLTLAAACIFTFGFHPGRTLISLEDIDETQRFLKEASNRRFWSGLVGFFFLLFGIASTVYMLADA
jgi:hypothetical protein